MTIRILLADDHKILREGLKKLIEEEDNLEVIGESKNGPDTVRLTQKLKPDLIIMDISMPELSGIEATRRILKEIPGIKVIALSMHSDSRYVMDMLEVGAKGYLLKDCAFDEIIHAIHAVIEGKTYLSPGVTDIVVDSSLGKMGKQPTNPARSLLSSREIEILQLLSEGARTKDIAEKLFISQKTVETHRRNIMTKLKLDNIADLVRFAIREGLTTIDR